MNYAMPCRPGFVHEGHRTELPLTYAHLLIYWWRLSVVVSAFASINIVNPDTGPGYYWDHGWLLVGR